MVQPLAIKGEDLNFLCWRLNNFPEDVKEAAQLGVFASPHFLESHLQKYLQRFQESPSLNFCTWNIARIEISQSS